MLFHSIKYVEFHTLKMYDNTVELPSLMGSMFQDTQWMHEI